MTQVNINNDLTTYYQNVQKMGKLPTLSHAQRWSTAILKTLGVNLDRRTKKELAQALPEELANALTRVFWLKHFRDNTLSSYEFQNQVARRSGHTDAIFAKFPVTAVFHGIKAQIDNDLSKKVADTLSPELSELWQKA